MFTHQPHRFGNISQVGGAVGAQASDVRLVPQRLLDHRTFAGREMKGQPHDFERKQQIGKDNGRIHTQGFSGGNRDFGRYFGLLQISISEYCLRTARYSGM